MALIAAHEANKEQTTFNAIIGKQAELLVDDSVIHKLVGKQVGVYQLTKKLGQGGMGAVYLGERNDGQLEQRVAVKFVYPSIVALAGEDFLLNEAQHLANLDHVNIAKIYTVDKTEENLPYMVMEFVDGVPLDEYCLKEEVSHKARLGLLIKVCNAVGLAHQNMIIHADIKPSNILVNTHGEPKLMDFGIAQSLNEYDDSVKLKAASREFASPEQLDGKKLTVATDIYALGMISKKILNNGKTPSKELETLLSSALSSDSQTQIPSVFILEQELNSLKNNEPLVTMKGGFFYRLRKLVARNPVSSLSTAALFSLSVVGAVLIFFQNKQLIIEKQIAEQNITFLESVFEYSSPYENQEKGISVEDVLNNALTKLEANTQLHTESEDRVKLSLVNAFLGIGSFDKAKALLGSVDSNNPFILSEKLFLQANLAERALNYDVALKNIADALLITDKRGQKELYVEIRLLEADTYQKLSEFEESKNIYSSLLAFARRNNDVTLETTINVHLSMLYFRVPNYEKSLEHSQAALSIYTTNTLGDKSLLSNIYHNYGSAMEELDRFDDAEEIYLKVLELDKGMFGDNHPATAINYNLMSYFYHTMGTYPLALEYADKAIEIHKQFAPYSGSEYVDSLFNKAHAHKALSEPREAIAALLEADDIFKTFLPEGHANYINLYNGLGVLYKHITEFEKGKEYLNKALEIGLTNELANKSNLATTYGNLANIAVEQGDYQLAEDYYYKRHDINVAIFGMKSRHVSKSLLSIARMNRYKGDYEKALELTDEAQKIALKAYPQDHTSLTGFYSQKALTYKHLNRIDSAVLEIQEALRIAKKGYGDESFSTQGFNRILADLYLQQGKYQQAHDLAKVAYEYQLGLVGEEHLETQRAKTVLVEASKYL
ncbi:serine/threonine-protein kinase [Alteromonas sp. V450]|uniref:serine/threonine-protein kinase n=1 Tax=Alteromonas sp. V450 TaxID=1912139 RepID=UPI00210CFA09|nr:serine/threonine-protein kinase [Alteromonas sp. V450]